MYLYMTRPGVLSVHHAWSDICQWACRQSSATDLPPRGEGWHWPQGLLFWRQERGRESEVGKEREERERERESERETERERERGCRQMGRRATKSMQTDRHVSNGVTRSHKPQMYKHNAQRAHKLTHAHTRTHTCAYGRMHPVYVHP